MPVSGEYTRTITPEDGRVIAPASGEYTITPEDGRVRPKHVDD
jgi:hypothetical protein